MNPIAELEHLAELIERKICETPVPACPAAELPPPAPATWAELLPGLLKRLAFTKSLAGNPRALERYRLLDERDPRAVAQTLYLFGDCHHFAAAVAERYGLRAKIWHIFSGNVHRHVVVEVGPDRYFDYAGIHSEADLLTEYSDAAEGIEARLIQDRTIDPRPGEIPAAYDLAKRVLMVRERESDFGIPRIGH